MGKALGLILSIAKKKKKTQAKTSKKTSWVSTAQQKIKNRQRSLSL
jgi:hypothetical protein